MSKEQHHSKNIKKKALLSPKEKKAAKTAKKLAKLQVGAVDKIK